MAGIMNGANKRRWWMVVKAVAGYITGRVTVRVTTGQLDPGRPEDRPEGERTGLIGGGGSIVDDIVTVGGAAWAARTAVAGHQHADFFLGLSVGLGTPILDGITDRITDAIESKAAQLRNGNEEAA